MSTVIDAFKYEQALRAAGVSVEQATALSQALSDAVIEAIATKADLAELRAYIAENTAKLLMWVIGTQFTLLSLATAIILKFAGHA